ncbi:MAG: hypothetical protein EBZ49_03685 [Proteobacteria bacterium]|nr:hypothetical protein [Pseudomonadota bacterium]
MKTALPEFDPVVSILIRELAYPPKSIETDEQAHNWLMGSEPHYYDVLLRLAGEIRNVIYKEVDSALWTSTDDDEQEIYNAAIEDCLKIIETRGEGPL